MEATEINSEHAQKSDPEQHQKSNPEQVQKPDLEPGSKTLVDRPVISIEEKNQKNKHQGDARRNIEAVTTWFQALHSDIPKMAEKVRTMKPPYSFNVFDLKPDPEPKEDEFPIDHCERCARRAAKAAEYMARSRKRARGETSD